MTAVKLITSCDCGQTDNKLILFKRNLSAEYMMTVRMVGSYLIRKDQLLWALDTSTYDPISPLQYPLQRPVTDDTSSLLVNHPPGALDEAFIFLNYPKFPSPLLTSLILTMWRWFAVVSEVLCWTSLKHHDVCTIYCLPLLHDSWVGQLICPFISPCMTWNNEGRHSLGPFHLQGFESLLS